MNKTKHNGSTHPLMLLATEEWREMDFGDISNSESDLGNEKLLTKFFSYLNGTLLKDG